jgi:hypothetical protein
MLAQQQSDRKQRCSIVSNPLTLTLAGGERSAEGVGAKRAREQRALRGSRLMVRVRVWELHGAGSSAAPSRPLELSFGHSEGGGALSP